MNLPEIRRLASGNLRQTYFQLGLSLPNTSFVEEQGFQICIGDFDHPICNFAAGLCLDPWSTRRLKSIAASRPSFNVYALPGDEPDHLDELLRRNDFRVSYRMAQLAAEAKAEVVNDAIREVETTARLETAKFMTEQFFPRQTESFRRRVAQATADSQFMRLFEQWDGRHRVGALMLCETEQVLGVYNLCVAHPRRGEGFGRNLTEWALGFAGQIGKLVTLQCDSRLQPWYESQGFRQTGTVDVYTLPKSGRRDIMEST